MSQLIDNGVALAKRNLAKHGKPATITWVGEEASAVRDAVDVSSKVTLLPGKRETRIEGNIPVIVTHAVMSPVKRNPLGATITQGKNTYRVVAADDLGSAPNAVAAHRLVLV